MAVLFLHWWVLIKFAISMVQVYLGIFVLSPTLTDSVTAGPSLALVVGTALMASAIAFQSWLSVRKPWGAVRGRRRAVAGTGPGWIFVATVLGGLAELALALVLGHPLPLLSLILIVVVLPRRPSWSGSRRTRPAQA